MQMKRIRNRVPAGLAVAVLALMMVVKVARAATCTWQSAGSWDTTPSSTADVILVAEWRSEQSHKPVTQKLVYHSSCFFNASHHNFKVRVKGFLNIFRSQFVFVLFPDRHHADWECCQGRRPVLHLHRQRQRLVPRTQSVSGVTRPTPVPDRRHRCW